MPRRPRVFVEGGIYHVYNRFARGAAVFGEGDEAERFLELLRKVRDRDDLTIFAWALMNNHYHLALRAGPVPLARTMGYVQSRFGQGYNRRWRSSGPLWQSRYKAILVKDPTYFARLVVYIHLNPVTAGLVDDPGQYLYCGHRELLGGGTTPLVDVERVLALYGATLRKARGAYVRALRAARETPWIGEGPGALPWWPREVDRSLTPAAPSAWLDEQGRSTGLPRAPLDAGRFLELACQSLGVEIARLAGESQDREVSRLRYLVAALAVERWGVRAKALGELLGKRPENVTRWAARGAQARQADEEFRKAYEELDRGLVEIALELGVPP